MVFFLLLLDESEIYNVMCSKSLVFKLLQNKKFSPSSMIFFFSLKMFFSHVQDVGKLKGMIKILDKKASKCNEICIYATIFRTSNENGTTITMKLRNLKQSRKMSFLSDLMIGN